MSHFKQITLLSIGFWVATDLALQHSALAADANPAAANAQPSAANSLEGAGNEAERVNIENIKQKYWARGDENELGVVQNRTYTKARHIEIGIFGGIVATDPFLSVQNLGGLLGYHFNEYLAFSLMGYKSFSNPSSALQLLQLPVTQGGLGTTANVNNPNWFLGAEVAGSFLYGKLSLAGQAIIHYDMHVLAGAGETAVRAVADGTNYDALNFTPYIGIGQQVYLTKALSIRLDYRLMRYNETIIQQVLPSQMGQPVGDRINYANSVTLGVDLLFNLFGQKTAPAESTK